MKVRDAAIQALREHYHKSNDQWTQLLKQTDRQARQVELIRFTGFLKQEVL